jgi:hypothetical protein
MKARGQLSSGCQGLQRVPFVFEHPTGPTLLLLEIKSGIDVMPDVILYLGGKAARYSVSGQLGL